MLGNLVDATALAIPCGVFPGTPALPRSLQIIGPPGSEEAVLDLGARLVSAARG
jgi:Asp-tRNA(Asn)/Glu-tRNA(Gln) amidotransferase A subunit family amidase